MSRRSSLALALLAFVALYSWGTLVPQFSFWWWATSLVATFPLVVLAQPLLDRIGRPPAFPKEA